MVFDPFVKQNIVDMRDNSSGIAIYFIAENGSDLCSLVLDAVPAILYTQQVSAITIWSSCIFTVTSIYDKIFPLYNRHRYTFIYLNNYYL